MPSYVVTSPDGKEYDIDAPEGATEDDVLAYAQSQFEKPTEKLPEQPRGAVDGIGRQLGLTARYGIEGLAALPAMAGNVLAAGSNKLLGTQIPEQGQALSNLLTRAGLPQPETGTERVVGDISRAATGAGGLIRGAGTQIAKGISPLIAESLSAAPLVEGVSAATSAGSSGLARESGIGPVGQTIAGLAGGVGGGLAASRFTPRTPSINTLFEDISERGIDETGAFDSLRKQLGNEAAKIQEEISGTFVNGQKVRPGLFDIAKDRGKNLFISKDSINELSGTLRQQLKDEIDDDAKNILNNTVTRLDALGNNATLNDIEGLRRAASKISAVGGSKGYTGGTIVGEVDNFLDNIVNKGGIKGDVAAIDIWKKAIAKRREFGSKFEKPQIIAKSINDKLTNEQVEQAFIGAGGASLNKGLSETYKNTLKALPKDQQNGAGFLLRQSIVNRMVKNAAQSSDSGEGISAMRLANQIRNFRRENKSMWNKFPDDEKRILNTLDSNLRKETKGGPINIIAEAMTKILRRATRSNLELPRTLKPKTIITIDDLLELTKIKPELKTKLPVVVGTATGIQSTKE